MKPFAPRPSMGPVRLLSAIAAASIVAACSMGDAASAPPLDRANLDTTCAPCKDFYQFANGGWLKKNTIPAAYGSFGSFRALDDHNQDALHKILDQLAADAKSGRAAPASGAFKVGAYYASCLDTVAIDKLGTAPLKPLLDEIDRIKSADDLRKALPSLEAQAGLAPWINGSIPDSKDSKAVIAGLYQGGLSLPDRDYYFKTDSATKEVRRKFLAHLERMFALLGEPQARAAVSAKTVADFETRFARASKTPVELRDPVANYHKMTPAQLAALSPRFPWAEHFAAQGAPSVTAIDVGQPEFFKAVDGMLTSVPVEEWKTVLRWRAAHGAAPDLTSEFVRENFAFNQLFSGAKELLPRWKRCATATDNQLGELLGQEYVKTAFTPEAKERALKIVGNLVDELRARLEKLEWMTAPTKTQALAKLGAFTRKIGYPDKWKDYSALTIKAGEHHANVLAGTQWAAKRDWAKIGKPVDRTEWLMTPPTVNAYYNPLYNEIVFPAGILQPPFYDPKADDAVNYGAMGAVIGHEMTHGFDDQGRQFDKDGNLKDWWTKVDADKYNAEAAKVVTQFSAYTVLDSATHVNGELTLGENIADFGGLTVAYSALQKALGNGPRTAIDGFTHEQRFFLGWAQVWRTLYRDEALRSQVNSNPHSPAIWRTNGPLSIMPEFQAAFGCKDGDAMVVKKEAAARIW